MPKIKIENLRVLRRRAKETQVALRALKEAMGDFDDIDLRTPAVRPDPKDRRAIKKAVRAFYRGPKALERT
jgi:hypothetical protein